MPANIHEQRPESLLELYGEKLLETEGGAFTLNELSGICPVPPEERSFEANQKFAAKLLHNSGVELAEEHTQWLETPPEDKPLESLEVVKKIVKLEPASALPVLDKKKRVAATSAKPPVLVNNTSSKEVFDGEATNLDLQPPPDGPPPELPSLESFTDVSYEENRPVHTKHAVTTAAKFSKQSEVWSSATSAQSTTSDKTKSVRPKHSSHSIDPTKTETALSLRPIRVRESAEEQRVTIEAADEKIAAQQPPFQLSSSTNSPFKVEQAVKTEPKGVLEISPTLELPADEPDSPRLFDEAETVQIRRTVSIESEFVPAIAALLEYIVPPESFELPAPNEEASELLILMPAETEPFDFIVPPETTLHAAGPKTEQPEYRPVIASKAEKSLPPAALPIKVQQRMTQVFEVAPPIEKVKIAQLHVSIAHTVEKLQKLTGKEHDHEEQKVQLQEELGELYEELLTNLEIEVDEEAVAQFVEAAIPDLETEASFLDQAEVFQSSDGTHERKLFALSLAKNLPKWVSRRHNTLAKFILELTTAPSLEYAPAVQVS